MSSKNLIRSLLCVAIIIGFFLPWVHGYKNLSGLDLLTKEGMWEGGGTAIIRFSIILVPLLPLIVLFNTVRKKPSSRLLQSGAFIVMAVYAIFFLVGISTLDVDIPSEERSNIFQFIRMGFYLSFIGSLLLLFVKEKAGTIS